MANWIFLLLVFTVSVLKMSESIPFDYYDDDYSYETNYSSNQNKLVQDYKDAVRKTLPRLFNICPEVRMSDTLENPKSNVTYSDFNGTSCCKPCSVAQDCNTMHNYNFCCPQAEMAFYDRMFTESAFCSSTVIDTRRNIRGLSEYMIVDDCPNKEVYPENTFEDIVLVHSNGVLYKNKYIAECNGATKYKRWQLLATGCDFPTLMQRTRREELLLSIKKNCIVYSAPPKGFDSSHFVCYSHELIIDVCNVTGLWDEYDMEIEFLCETAVSHALDTEGRVYRSVFCLACNQPSTYLEVPQTCERPWSHEHPFSGGIYTILPDNYVQNDTESSCDAYDVLDIYLNKCRPLLCPSRHLPYNGKCSDTQDKTSVFQVILRLSPSDWLKQIFIIITPENHKANNAQLLAYFGLLQVCKVQSNYLYTYRMAETGINADFVIYDLRLNISSICNESFLSLKLQKIIDKFPLQVGQTTVNVTVQMIIPLLYDPLIHTLEPIATFKDNACGTCLIKMLIPLECPYIKLQLEELCYLYKKKHLTLDKVSCSNIATYDWFKENVILGDDIVDGVWSRVPFMCVHQYNNIFADKSSKEKTNSVSTTSQSATLNIYYTLYVCVPFLVLFTATHMDSIV